MCLGCLLCYVLVCTACHRVADVRRACHVEVRVAVLPSSTVIRSSLRAVFLSWLSCFLCCSVAVLARLSAVLAPVFSLFFLLLCVRLALLPSLPVSAVCTTVFGVCVGVWVYVCVCARLLLSLSAVCTTVCVCRGLCVSDRLCFATVCALADLWRAPPHVCLVEADVWRKMRGTRL